MKDNQCGILASTIGFLEDLAYGDMKLSELKDQANLHQRTLTAYAKFLKTMIDNSVLPEFEYPHYELPKSVKKEILMQIMAGRYVRATKILYDALNNTPARISLVECRHLILKYKYSKLKMR
jgi:hypothetical protein